MQRSKKDTVNVVWFKKHGYICQAHPNRGQHGLILGLIRIHWELCDFKEKIIVEWLV